MEKVKWGIIGTGKIAKKFANDMPFSQHGTLVAVGSRNMESAEGFAHQYALDEYYDSYEALLDNDQIEAIYVATPHNFHFQNASDALRAGKSVLCEKPLTINPAECKALLEVAKDTNQYLMEGMWTYFLPSILKVQAWISEGKIGDITHIKVDFGFKAPFDPNGRLFNPDLAGGAMLDIGIYPIALSWLLMKKPPINIMVTGTRSETNVDLESTYVFAYDGDVTAVMGCSLRCQLPNTGYIIGTDGYIEIPKFWMSDEAILHRKNEEIEHFKAPRKSNGFEYEIDAVSKDIRAGKIQSDVVPLAYSLALQEHMAMVLAKF